MCTISVLVALVVCLLALVCAHPNNNQQRPIIAEPHLTINGVPPSTRAYWMRQASIALGAPCPFAAFGTVIVNHTAADGGLGELVCTGANSNSKTGNPIMHGEMAAITNCSSILTDPDGRYKLTPTQALDAFAHLSLYTNAESCPMCASAIRWAGLKEYIYGTSIDTLIAKGWAQIRLSSLDVMAASFDLAKSTRLLGGVLANETDGLFLWQFDEAYPCPKGCERGEGGGGCKAVS